MKIESSFIELNSDQRRALIDSQQLWQVWTETEKRAAGYKGSMRWRTLKGVTYLIRIDAYKRENSLGPISEETKELYETFLEGKRAVKERVKTLKGKLNTQAKINKALGIGRVPVIAAKVLRQLDRVGLLGNNVSVVGTNALFAYEAVCGVFISRDATATADLDIIYGTRTRLRLGAVNEPDRSFIAQLKKADRSFQRMDNQQYRAVNDDGYMVDLIHPEANPPWAEMRTSIGEAADDLQSSAIQNLNWIGSARRFDAIAIDEQGTPVRIATIDPREFALFKYWMGTKAENREPVKRHRDFMQAFVTAHLVTAYLPHLAFTPEEMQTFPKVIREAPPPEFWEGKIE
ncbi:MAG: nucleotidyltransferase domain-containing protein [Sneathiella sp.]|nr:nucleotidyltransferase domain-containing protein [Sneathiella sp.]